jgi:hypothetical protein
VSFGLSYGFSVGEGNPRLGDDGKYVWENDSGAGDIELTFTDNANPIGSAGISFDGDGDYGRSVNTVDLSGADKVTVEVCFRVATGGDYGGIPFETTSNWNPDPGGRGALGASINNHGGGYESGTIHTVGRVGSGYTGAGVGARNFNYTDDRNRFNTISLTFSKVEDPTGRLAYVNGILVPFTTKYNSGSTATYPATPANSTDHGDFADDFLYLARRGAANSFFKGEIAALRIYDHKLSSYEIARNAAADDARYNR